MFYAVALSLGFSFLRNIVRVSEFILAVGIRKNASIFVHPPQLNKKQKRGFKGNESGKIRKTMKRKVFSKIFYKRKKNTKKCKHRWDDSVHVCSASIKVSCALHTASGGKEKTYFCSLLVLQNNISCGQVERVLCLIFLLSFPKTWDWLFKVHNFLVL